MVASLAFVACSESAPTAVANNALGPDEVDVAAVAAALDGEAFSAAARGESNAADSYRDAALALRFGVRPSVIAVSVNGTIERYQAVVTAVVQHLAPGDTALRRSVVAWHGTNHPLAILRVSTLGDQGSFSSADEPATNPRSRAEGVWLNFVRDSRWRATAGTAGINVAQIGQPCNIDARTHAEIRCVEAQFGFGVDGLFRLHGAGPDDGLAAVRIMAEPQRVNGVILARVSSDRGQ